MRELLHTGIFRADGGLRSGSDRVCPPDAHQLEHARIQAEFEFEQGHACVEKTEAAVDGRNGWRLSSTGRLVNDPKTPNLL